MTSDTIQKQVEDIRRQSRTILEGLSILVLFLVITLFVFFWFSDFYITGLYWMGASNSSWIDLNYCLTKLVISLVFLVGIVWYFWWVRDKPQFHIIFIESWKEQRYIDTKRSLTLLLISVGISIPLSILMAFQEILRYDWWNPTLWQSFEHPYWQAVLTTPSPIFYPLIFVACSSLLLYVAYRVTLVYHISPAGLQESLLLLLSIPIILAIFAEALQTSYLLFDPASGWYACILNNTPPLRMSFMRDVIFVSEHLLFFASLAVLFYLTYHINVDYKNYYTRIREKHLPRLIEEGIAILPKKVRVDTSHSISVELKLAKDFLGRSSKTEYPYKSSDYLEAELQGVALNVDGEKRLRVYETSPLPIITWSYSFVKSSIQTITLMMTVVKTLDNSRDVVFTQKNEVYVDSVLNNLVISWVPALALITPILVVVVQTLLR